MENNTAFQEKLLHQQPAAWDQLPDFSLYMDQVLSYIDRQVIHQGEADSLTSAMVNNYAKHGLIPRAEGKKYNRDHLAYLTAICILKKVMPSKDMDLLIRTGLQGERSISDVYDEFCSALGRELRAAAEEIDRFSPDRDIADTAIHFALISYAASVCCNHFVNLLREQKSAAEAAEKDAKKAAKQKAKEAKGK